MTTLAELTASVTSYLNSNEPTFLAELNTFVRAAEDRISFGLQLPAGRYSVSGLLTIDVNTVPIPPEAQSVLYITLVNGAELVTPRPVQPDFIHAAYSPAARGVPKRYAIEDADTILLGPAPDAAYAYTLHYAGRPVSLVDSPSGTWLSRNLINALRWATIVEGYTFLKGDRDQMDVYLARLEEAMAQAQLLVNSKLRTDAARNGEPVLTPAREL